MVEHSQGNSKDKYGLAQGDFYQLYAYGQYYLGGRGDLVLIYPKTDTFEKALPVFSFNENLRLWVLPFDLEAKELLLPIEKIWARAGTCCVVRNMAQWRHD